MLLLRSLRTISWCVVLYFYVPIPWTPLWKFKPAEQWCYCTKNQYLANKLILWSMCEWSNYWMSWNVTHCRFILVGIYMRSVKLGLNFISVKKKKVIYTCTFRCMSVPNDKDCRLTKVWIHSTNIDNLCALIKSVKWTAGDGHKIFRSHTLVTSRKMTANIRTLNIFLWTFLLHAVDPCSLEIKVLLQQWCFKCVSRCFYNWNNVSHKQCGI